VRRLLLVLSLVMLLGSGCVRSRPRVSTQPSPLDVPPPPPRVIVPPEPEEPPDEKVADEPEAAAHRPNRPRPQPTRERATEPAKPAETKPETPPAEARPPVAPAVQPGALQPVLPASPTEMDRRVSDQLSQAKRDLDRTDYRALSADGKTQYDTAKRFIEQASQALREKNLVFAAKLAEKAAGLAAGLIAR
jgi:hypothetical protein